MDKEYNFSWLASDIDKSIIFILRDGKETVGNYQVSGITLSDFSELAVKFANIRDLEHFVNYSYVRFTDYRNNDNFIEIPLSKLNMLYKQGKKEGEEQVGIGLDELSAFAICNEAVINRGYAIYVYKISEATEELETIMKITENYGNLSMDEKINALEEINLINYQRDDDKQIKRT